MKNLLLFLEYASHEMNNLPSIVCIVTGKKYFYFNSIKNILFIIGKGPLKEQFIEQVERERDQYQHVEFCFPWLDADDYPLLLGTRYIALYFVKFKKIHILLIRLCGYWCKSSSIIKWF